MALKTQEDALEAFLGGIDPNDPADLRRRLAEAPTLFLREAGQKTLRDYRKSTKQHELAEFKSEFVALLNLKKARLYEKCRAEKEQGVKWTEKGIEAFVDQDPGIVDAEARYRTEVRARQEEILQEDMAENMRGYRLEAMKMAHRSLLALCGDTSEERVFS